MLGDVVLQYPQHRMMEALTFRGPIQRVPQLESARCGRSGSPPARPAAGCPSPPERSQKSDLLQSQPELQLNPERSSGWNWKRVFHIRALQGDGRRRLPEKSPEDRKDDVERISDDATQLQESGSVNRATGRTDKKTAELREQKHPKGNLNHELSKLFNELWDADVNRMSPGKDYRIALQGKAGFVPAGSHQARDSARLPLFKFVNEEKLKSIKTFAAFISLLDNYEMSTGVCRSCDLRRNC
ncbi:unnamed protein product [Ranitomeya imitator]|uniref:Protein endoU n=1 Tax=Ranitomeya imitator TaxID=111125 RepID=A0ABN9LYI4_9NEOB|nr:unnamed protein product [Ranitomeya imitator]